MKVVALCVIFALTSIGAEQTDELIQSLATVAAFRSHINGAVIAFKYAANQRAMDVTSVRQQYDDLGNRYKAFIGALNAALEKPDQVRSAVTAAEALDRGAEAFLGNTRMTVGNGTSKNLLMAGPFVQLLVSALLLRAKKSKHDRSVLVGEITQATAWTPWQEVR